MKHFYFLLLVLFSFTNTNAQNIQELNFGQNTIKGQIILKNLKNFSNGVITKSALVLKLTQKIKFKATTDDEVDVITDEIRIYGNLKDYPYVLPNIKYKNIVNKTVIINAKITYAATLNYALQVNIAQGFIYEIVK